MHPTKWTHGKPWKSPGDLKRARLEVAQSRADIAVAKPDMTLSIDQNKFAYKLRGGCCGTRPTSRSKSRRII